MGRYSGTLHKLVDSASTSNSKTKWNQVLHYLEGHTISNNNVVKPAFESPLPPYSSPSSELETELFDQQGPKKEDTPLKIAVKNAPAAVVAALCHLGPEAAKLADGRDRLPIHWACRRSPDDEDTEKVIQILVKSAPETLLQRDEGGRTPLHWLFWYHAPTRSASLVKFVCQQLPVDLFHEIRQPRDSHNERYPLPDIPIPDGQGLPANAAIIPDSRHGAIPLHYAVMQGATKEAMKILISEYPNSTAYGDRKGRTALAWYLGAGHLMDNSKRHVCGEANDPNATPWWHIKLSPALVQLLISSKVARIADDMGRTPLHWACHFYARNIMALESPNLPLKAVQIVVDNNIEAVVAQDSDGRTPLHVLFAIVAEQQEQDHKRMVANRLLRDDIDLVRGGPAAFHPSKEFIELLLKSTDVDGQDQGFRFETNEKKPSTASYIEDAKGFLPLHNALRVATEPEIIKILIQSNPTGLIHASEEDLLTPLVQAFNSDYTAPLQPLQTLELLMAAYVTSRHGTFIDGRVSLKMEDGNGNYPIHYACRCQASTESIRSFVEKFPHCAVHLNAEGDLPLHCLLSEDGLFDLPQNGLLKGATLCHDFDGLQTEKEISLRKKVQETYREKIRILVEPLRTKQYLKIGSSAHGMTPLHVAVAFGAAPYTALYRMLDTYPDAAAALTTVKDRTFSCMDLHERTKDDAEDSDAWGAVRELLFAFNPRLDDYRRNEEILDACVQLIRNEITGKGSYHLQELPGRVNDYTSLELKDTLSTLDLPEIDVAYRPKSSRKNKNEPAKQAKKSPKKQHYPSVANTATSSFGAEKKVEKSIYDDDLDDRYVVSPQNSMDQDDEDDFLSSDDGEEEEYYSDDDSPSLSGEGTSFDQSTNKSSWDRGLSSGTGPSGTFTESASPTSGKFPASRSSSPNKIAASRSWKNTPRATSSPRHIEEKKEDKPDPLSEAKIVLSDVAMRLWCFFLLYHDPKKPEDNYAKEVEAVTEELDYNILEKLLSWPVPDYAEVYLEQGTSLQGVTLGDVACPTSKAIFKRAEYFLGKYEFPTELDGILLHRTSDGSTVYVRATEHVIRTLEYLPKQEFSPGEAEETIWATGENVEEEGGYMTSKFIDKKRSVCFKLTKNQEGFDNEVQCRSHLGMVSGKQYVSNILPLFDSFDALSGNKKGRRYVMDINDERFQTLDMFGGESIRLSDYPYALIYPYCDEGDLFDFFFHHGLDGIEEVSAIGRQIVSALKTLHEQGVVHGNISMRHVNMVPMHDEASHRSWVLSDFSTASRSLTETAFMGTISHNGSAQFETGLLPPEMFVKLSAAEARIYQTYWEMVERVYKVQVDKKVVEPFINLQTGATYALRCHFVPSNDQQLGVALPELPYQLVPARESTDVWCIGLIIFTLCSGGRPLFPSNLKTGHLLDYESIVTWNHERAAAQIYEHVQDPIAQDLLLHLLSPFEDRVELSMEIVLSHPFFNRGADTSKLLGRMIDKRQNESAAYDRRRREVVSEKSEDNWLDSRTTAVECWNFDILRKFNFSSTEIVSKLLGQRTGALSMPCNFILLPYKLSAKNKKAKLAPTTKKDVERAERMGVLLLSLGKVCFFACQVKKAIEASKEKQWTASKLLEDLVLPDGDFETVKEDFTKIAAAHIEAFRVNPIAALLRLIERRIAEIRKFFKDAGQAFLYLVDEYAGIPLVGAAYGPYPLPVAESAIDKLLVRALPFMHISVLYSRGVSGGVSGLVRLIFEAAYPHVPPSWASAASGLPHVLDENLFINEISMLRDALGLLYSNKTNFLADDLRYVRDLCLKVDSRSTFAEMQRVVSSGSALWTTKEGAAEIQESCKTFGFKEALQIQTSLEAKLTSQEQQLKNLQVEIERLQFRRNLDLDVPENPTRQSSNLLVVNVVSTPTAGNDWVIEKDGKNETHTISDDSNPPVPTVVLTPKADNDRVFEKDGKDETFDISNDSSPPAHDDSVAEKDGKKETPTMSNESNALVPTAILTPKARGDGAIKDEKVKTSYPSNPPPVEPASAHSRSPTECGAPIFTSSEEFYDSKENSFVTVVGFDANRKAVEAKTSKEEKSDDGGDDGSICKSDADSLREVLSLD